MSVATISSKGQISLPIAFRKKLGIKPHDRVVVESSDDAIIIRAVPDFFALEGFLGAALPQEEERAHARRAASKRASGRKS